MPKKWEMTKKDYEYLNKRIKSMTGFFIAMKGLKIRLDKQEVERKIILNEIKALNKRMDMLRQRFRNHYGKKL